MKTSRQLEIEMDLRSRHKGMMNISEIAEELGLTNRQITAEFVEGLPSYLVGHRRKWRIADIARRLADYET